MVLRIQENRRPSVTHSVIWVRVKEKEGSYTRKTLLGAEARREMVSKIAIV